MTRQRHTSSGLTPKQSAFVDGIAQGMTGVDAARHAEYGGPPSALTSIASRLLRHEGVRAALRARGVSLSGGRARGGAVGRSSQPQPVITIPPADAPLTSAQGRALEVLLGGGTAAEAAKAAKVGRATIDRWYQLPAFRAELDAQRLVALERARLRVEALADDSLGVAHAVLNAAGRCLDCGADIEVPTKEAQAMALAMLDRAGVGSRALDVPALRERMKGEAADAVIVLLKERLPAEVFRQVVEALRGGASTGGAAA